MAISYVGTVVHANLANAYHPIVEGNYLYITTSNGRLTILDISSPATPVVVGSVLATTNARGLCKKGNYVYVANNGLDRVVVVDVTNPAAPTVAGSVTNATTLDQVHGLVADPSRPYVYAWGDVFMGRLTVLNVTTPATPTIVASVTYGTVSAPANTRPAFDGRYFYGGTNDETYIIDLLTPAAPSLTASVFYSAMPIIVDGNTAYLQEGSGLAVLDVTTKAAPVDLGYYTAPDTLRGLAKIGNFVYMVNTPDGYIIEVDTTDPTSMTSIVGPAGHFGFDEAGFLEASAPYLYVPDTPNSAIDVFEITDPGDIGGGGASGWQVGSVAF